MAHGYKEFVVIKILSQRNNDLEQYVCIPKTWIKVKDCDNDDVVFGYPSEQRDNIARLINQSLDKRWPTLFGEVVHKTECQEDAFRVLKNKNYGEEHKTESKPENKKTKATLENEKSSSKKIKRKRKQTDSGDKTQNKQAKAKRSKDDEFKLQLSKLMKMLLKGKDSDRHESPSSSSSSEESDTEESEAEESESISNEDNDIPTTSRRSARAQSSKPDGYYRHIDDSSDSDYVPGYDTNSKNKSTVKKGKSKRKVSESNRLNRSNQSEPSDNNENDAVDISDTNLCQINDEVHSQCRNFYTEFNESYKKTMSILDNAVNYFQQVKEEVSKVSEKKSKDDKERFKKISESQPPFDASRYSTGDTKWTILYPGPCPGLVELIPHTGVYVSEEGLNECKETSKDATTLARALLKEIFKMEALFVCSFTGSVPKRGSMNNLKARPGLDVKARETLVCYAIEYGCEKNMDKADKERITNSIKNALQKYHSLSPEEKKKLLKKQASSKVNFMK